MSCQVSNNLLRISHFPFVAGRCWAAVAGEPAIRIEQGSTSSSFPQGDAHVNVEFAGGCVVILTCSQLEDRKISTQICLFPLSFRRETRKG